MPALVACGRRWHVATDDIPLFAAPTAFFHVGWCIVLGLALSFITRPTGCHHYGEPYFLFIKGLLGCFVAASIIEVWMIVEGSKGTPMEVSKRRFMPALLYLHTLATLGEVAMNVYGTIIVASHIKLCQGADLPPASLLWNPRPLVKALVITTWLILAFNWFLVLIVYNAFPEQPGVETWETRCRMLASLLCCLPLVTRKRTGRKAPLQTISESLSTFVKNVDMTPSDVVTAVLLVAAAQRQRRQAALRLALRALKRHQEDERSRAGLPQDIKDAVQMRLSEAGAGQSHYPPTPAPRGPPTQSPAPGTTSTPSATPYAAARSPALNHSAFHPSPFAQVQPANPQGSFGTTQPHYYGRLVENVAAQQLGESQSQPPRSAQEPLPPSAAGSPFIEPFYTSPAHTAPVYPGAAKPGAAHPVDHKAAGISGSPRAGSTTLGREPYYELGSKREPGRQPVTEMRPHGQPPWPAARSAGDSAMATHGSGSGSGSSSPVTASVSAATATATPGMSGTSSKGGASSSSRPLTPLSAAPGAELQPPSMSPTTTPYATPRGSMQSAPDTAYTAVSADYMSATASAFSMSLQSLRWAASSNQNATDEYWTASGSHSNTTNTSDVATNNSQSQTGMVSSTSQSDVAAPHERGAGIFPSIRHSLDEPPPLPAGYAPGTGERRLPPRLPLPRAARTPFADIGPLLQHPEPPHPLASDLPEQRQPSNLTEEAVAAHLSEQARVFVLPGEATAPGVAAVSPQGLFGAISSTVQRTAASQTASTASWASQHAFQPIGEDRRGVVRGSIDEGGRGEEVEKGETGELLVADQPVTDKHAGPLSVAGAELGESPLAEAPAAAYEVARAHSPEAVSAWQATAQAPWSSTASDIHRSWDDTDQRDQRPPPREMFQMSGPGKGVSGQMSPVEPDDLVITGEGRAPGPQLMAEPAPTSRSGSSKMHAEQMDTSTQGQARRALSTRHPREQFPALWTWDDAQHDYFHVKSYMNAMNQAKAVEVEKPHVADYLRMMMDEWNPTEEGGETRDPAPGSTAIDVMQEPLLVPGDRRSSMQPAFIAPTGMGDLLDEVQEDEHPAVAMLLGMRESVDTQVLEEALHYCKYALAVYGNMGLLVPPMEAPCIDTCVQLCCGGPKREEMDPYVSEQRGIGTVREWVNYRTVMEVSGLEEENLVYLNFSNEPLEALPYLVAVDERRQAIVIAIRGTVSLQDCITDVLLGAVQLGAALPTYLKGKIDDDQAWVHEGILVAANKILVDLKKRRLLEALLEGQSVATPSRNAPPPASQLATQLSLLVDPSNKVIFDPLEIITEAEVSTITRPAGTAQRGMSIGDAVLQLQSMGSSDFGEPLLSETGSRRLSRSISAPGTHRGRSYSVGSALPSHAEQELLKGPATVGEQAREGAPLPRVRSTGQLLGLQEEGRTASTSQQSQSEEPPESPAAATSRVTPSGSGGDTLEVPKEGGVKYMEEEMKREGGARKRHDCRGWPVIVTGHSLGAGAAAIVAMKLKERFPDVRCFAFAPPGGLMSLQLARALSDHCTSVVVGKDIISRLSMRTMERFRDEMVTCLARSRYHKLRVLLGGVSRAQRLQRAKHMLKAHRELPWEAQLALLQYHEAQEQLQGPQQQQKDLYPPGRIAFLQPFKRRTKVGRREVVERYFNPVWVDPQEMMDEGILVSGYLAEDHAPANCINALAKIIQQTKPEIQAAH